MSRFFCLKISVLLLFYGKIGAQTLISFSAATASNGQFSASSTAGELVISTNSNGPKTATQGFQQPADAAEETPDTSTVGPILVNTITPNDDGINDLFKINGADGLPKNRLVIWNRWMETVFEKNSYENDWAGTTNSGKDLPEAVYFYAFYPDRGSKKHVSGTITVIRAH